MSELSQHERFARLYKSNIRSIGKYDPKTGKMHTDYSEMSERDILLHFEGRVGLGVVPITDDDDCWWAAIDIDNHGQDEDIPIAPIDEYIRSNNLPLLPCRSKSGGVHVYLFLAEPVSAARVRDTLLRWSAALGYSGSEVFPKQTRLLTSGGKKQLGNWINLPYMGGAATERYCVRGGRKLSLPEFLDHAEKTRTTWADIVTLMMSEHVEAPPCIQRMMVDGVERGRRNEAMYNTVVYLKKLDGDDYSLRARELNKIMFEHPLAPAELSRTITSAAKPDYKYRCNEEPIKSLCNRELCLKRKYGITTKELERVDAQSALPMFSDLVQVATEPPRWELTIEGKHIVRGLTSTELLDFKNLRIAIMDRLMKVVPAIKPAEWERVLAQLMENVRRVEAPDDASPAGIVREKLRDFVGKIDLTSKKGIDTSERKALFRGMPVVQSYEGQRMVMFRGSDFTAYLKRTKSEQLRDINLWMAIRALGATHIKLRVGDRTPHVWCVPVEVFEGADNYSEPMTFNSEL